MCREIFATSLAPVAWRLLLSALGLECAVFYVPVWLRIGMIYAVFVGTVLHQRSVDGLKALCTLIHGFLVFKLKTRKFAFNTSLSIAAYGVKHFSSARF